MNALMAKLYRQNLPALNEPIMEGLACKYDNLVIPYLESVAQSAARSYPPELKFTRIVPCSPDEEFMELTKPRNNKRTFDLAKSNVYMLKYLSELHGKPLPPQYFSVLYHDRGAEFYIGGTLYHNIPVLSDKVISPGADSVFLRLWRDKITVRRKLHTIVVSGKRENVNFAWATLYRKHSEQKVPVTTRAVTSLAHYLLAKFGFSGLCLKYLGFVPVVWSEDKDDPTKENPDAWVIIESACISPSGYIGNFYKPTKIKMAIPVGYWSQKTLAFIAGIYYTLDHFPEYVHVSNMNIRENWMVLLGHILFSGLHGVPLLLERIGEHLTTIDHYVDTLVISKLKEKGLHIEDFYDLMALVIENFQSFILDAEQSNLSMFGKSLDILYYIYFDITSAFFRINYKITSKKGVLTEKDVLETYRKFLKPGAIYRVTNGKIMTEAVSDSQDHMYPKGTSRLVEQEARPGADRGKSKRLVVSENQHADVSMAQAGCLHFLSKSDPSPTRHANPFMHLDLGTATIIPNPELAELSAKAELMLKGKVSLVNSDMVFENSDEDKDE